MAWENDTRRVRAASASYTVLAGLQLVALARYGGEVRCSSPGAWLYVGFLAVMLALGAYLLAGRQRPRVPVAGR